MNNERLNEIKAPVNPNWRGLSMTERRNNAFLNRKAICIITALVITAASIYSLYYAYTVMFGHRSYHAQAYNVSAEADLRNARTCVEAYFADNRRYPETLEKAIRKERCGRNSVGVELSYERPGRGRYRIMSFHIEGDKEYMCKSDDTAIYWRDKKDPIAKWQPL